MNKYILRKLDIFIATSVIFNFALIYILIDNLATEKEVEISPKLDTKEINELKKGLYIYTWTNFCDDSLEKLKTWSLFPYYPIEPFTTIENLDIHLREEGNYSQRIFGYLMPPKTGKYFLKKNRENFEMWITQDKNRFEMQQILGENNRKRIDLEKDVQYYIEIMYTITEHSKGGVKVEWRMPGEVKFEIISGEYLFTSPQLIVGGIKPFGENLTQFSTENITKMGPKTQLYKLKPLKPIQVYKDCEYSPSFAFEQEMEYLYRAGEIIEKQWLSFYPEDSTHYNGEKVRNGVVYESEANAVFRDFKIKTVSKMEKVKDIKLINFEKQSDINASRYLLETEVTLHSELGRKFRFSYHVYAQENEAFCHPSNLNINFEVFVHIAISVKNQGHWLRYFLENMESLYLNTKDENFGVIIVDFESEDVDARDLIESSIIPNKELISLTGPYSRTTSLNAAINFVENKNDMIFVCDLQLDLPADTLHVIRTHTFQGVAGFAPTMFRLDCGSTTKFVTGNWEIYTYGMLSLYKSDWDNIGGFNEDAYTIKWGGEDWEVIDRLMEKGYFIERFNQPYFFHYFHDRKNMWCKDDESDFATNKEVYMDKTNPNDGMAIKIIVHKQ